jgi:hypothetical protein
MAEAGGCFQTLSRLNCTHPEKKGTMVLDFANESDEIKAAFEDYYETTLLSEATDPNLLYEVMTRLRAFPVYIEADVNAVAKVYFDPKASQDRLYAVLAPLVERFNERSRDERHDFRSQLTDYVRLYAFLSQVLTSADVDLETLYVFARHLRRMLPPDKDELPIEVQQNIDMESHRIQQTGSGKIASIARQGARSGKHEGRVRAGAGRGGGALPHHRRVERAFRAEPRSGAPRNARQNDGEARRRRGARSRGARQHAGERPAHLRPQSRERDPGDRRDQFRPVQAYYRRSGVRGRSEELPFSISMCGAIAMPRS